MSAAKSGERAGIFLCPIWAPPPKLGTASRLNRQRPSVGGKVTFARLRAVASFAHAPHPIAFSCRLPPRTFSPPSEMVALSVPVPSDHSPQVDGGIVFLRQLSPSGVSLCVSRSCIASCFSADRLSKFHGAQAYSG